MIGDSKSRASEDGEDFSANGRDDAARNRNPELDEGELEGAGTDSELNLLKNEIKTLEEERNEFKDKFLRAIADFDNASKRFEREKQSLADYGQERIFSDLLPVLDSFDKAVGEGAESAGDGDLRRGIDLVRRQLLDVLKNHGVKSFDSKGAKFDPNRHQAIQRVESDDVEEDLVKDEYVRGYFLKERLLRPAMVSVLVKKTSPEE